MGVAKMIWSVADWVKRKTEPEDFPFRPQPVAGYGNNTVKSWEDQAYELTTDAYATIYRNDVIMQPMSKFAEKLSGMQLTVVGTGKRRDKLQEIIDRSAGVGDILYWMAFAKTDGSRFVKHRAVLDEDSGLYVPDFRGCGARKWKAGGNIYWKGWQSDYEELVEGKGHSIGKVEEVSVGDPADKIDAKGAWYDRREWTVFRPGAGVNPEGDLELILQFYLIAESAQLLDKAMRLYSDRYGLPREILKKDLMLLRPDEMRAVLQAGSAKLAASDKRTRMTMPLGEVLELMEPKGTTWGFLTEYRAQLERRAHRLVFGEDITSGGQESGDRGGREIGQKQMFGSVIAFGKKIADALSEDWLPWLEELNEDELPRLKSDEPKPYLDLRPVAEKQQLTVAELKSVADMKIPLLADDVYATIGKDKPPGAPEVFDWKDTNPAPMGGAVPSNTGDSFQRKDREQKDSGMPPEKPQDPANDRRNLPKE